MKRKTTELEQKLIKKGFRLDHKDYIGKNSEKTLSYVYYGVVETSHFKVGVNVILDAKRKEIKVWGIRNLLEFINNPNTFTKYQLGILTGVMEDIETFIFNEPKNEQNADEIVEIVEEIENETQGKKSD